ncbi:hypothetical protein [Aquimarina macrocephali]|uniref:hypothetical protein n=1 Tax=Aquimarina macrocephali TaxID=666563 RepID=UPI000465F80A|nr:hypothetical protein [Aquimarina macrocephali]
MECNLDFQSIKALDELPLIIEKIKEAGGKIISYTTDFCLNIKIESDNPDLFCKKFFLIFDCDYQIAFNRQHTKEEEENIDWDKLGV